MTTTSSHFMRVLRLFFLLVLSTLLIPGHAQAGRSVRAGIYNFKPLVYTAASGSPHGLYVEILKQIALREDWDLQYVPGTWQQGLDRLKNNQIDLLLCIGYSEERAKHLDFPKEFLLLDWGLVYKAKGSSISTIMDLKGKTVGILKGSVYSANFQKLVSQFDLDVRFREMDQVGDIFKAIDTGKLEAGVTSNLPGILNETGFNVERTPIIFSPVKLGYGVNGGKNSDLIAALDRHIAAMKEDRSSVYHQEIERLLGKQRAPLSKTVYGVLLGGASALLLAISFVFVLRRQVRRKTEELKVSNQDLMVQAGRLASIIDGTTDAIFIKDVHGRYVVVNNEVVRLFARPKSEIIGHGDSDFFPPEEAAYLAASDKAIMDGGMVVTKEDLVTTLGNQRIYQATKGPVRDPSGAVTGLFGVARDITEFRQGEAQLKSLSQRLLLATQAGGVGIWELDLVHDDLIWDDQMFSLYGVGQDRPESTYDVWRAGVHPEDLPQVKAELQKAVRNHMEFDTEFRVIWPDGTLHHLKTLARVHYDSSGAAGNVIGVTYDITERKFKESVQKQTEHLLQLGNLHTELNDYLSALAASLKSWSGCEAVQIYLGQALGAPPAPQGYASVASVPLRVGDRCIGLLQFRDRRPNRFTAGMIDSLEAIAETLALTLERRTAEKERHKSEQLFRTLVNTIPDLIWLKDVNGVYLSCNRMFERLVGAKEADIIGKTDYDFFDRELAESFRDFDQKAMRANKPSSNEECITFADDGHRACLYTTKMPMYDTEGTIVGILGVGRDITEIKRAEEAMRESESRLRYALEGSNDGLWDIQYSTGRTYLSPRSCQILGYGKDETKDLLTLWSDLVHPDDLQVTEERLQAHIQGEAALFEVEQRLRTKGGDWRWIHTRGKVVERDGDGNPLRITGTHSDISEKKVLQSQLYQAQKMESVGSLAGGVAHDFNNKLSVILGHTHLALTDPDPAKLHESLEEIRKAAEQSADLTRQLLAFARKQTIAPKVLDLNETVGGMLKMLQRLIGEGIHLTWQPAADLWRLRFDPSQIDQILANLCVNARDSIADNGRITIETGNSRIDADYCAQHTYAAPGDYVRLAVSDNGCGMNQQTLKRIFDPFFTTKETGKGTGLGLATVFGIVKQNNGFINVYSEPGLGTTFTIYLPRYTGTAVQAQTKGSPMPAPRGLETILLVEDELAILEVATIILTRQGYNVLQANTPAEAIRLAKEEAGVISLLVTDVIMPQMNGKNLAAELRALNPGLKCLFMSGYTADAIAQHGVLDEGVNFIQKPFSLPSFATKVREVLDKV